MNTRQHQYQPSHRLHSRNRTLAAPTPVQTELKLEHIRVLTWTAAGLTVLIALAGFEAGVWCLLSRFENQPTQPQLYCLGCQYVYLPNGQKQCQ